MAPQLAVLAQAVVQQITIRINGCLETISQRFESLLALRSAVQWNCFAQVWANTLAILTKKGEGYGENIRIR